jgi:hypothetical protein
MAAKPKMFKRKVITSGGDNGTTRIMSDDGNAVKYEGRSNMKATQDALRENKSQSKDTNVESLAITMLTQEPRKTLTMTIRLLY